MGFLKPTYNWLNLKHINWPFKCDTNNGIKINVRLINVFVPIWLMRLRNKRVCEEFAIFVRVRKKFETKIATQESACFLNWWR